GLGLRDLLAGGAAGGALGDARGADAGLAGVAGLPASRAGDAGEEEDVVVEVAVVVPESGAGRAALEADVVRVRRVLRRVDQRGDPVPRRAAPGAEVVVSRVGVVRLAADQGEADEAALVGRIVLDGGPVERGAHGGVGRD